MPPKNTKKLAVARAQAGKARKQHQEKEVIEIEDSSCFSSSESDEDGITSWSGGVNSITEEEELQAGFFTFEGEEIGSEDDNEILEVLEGAEVIKGLWKACQVQQDLEQLVQPTPYEMIMKRKNAKEWKKAESNWGLGYNGLSE
ncbi:hypothetical protein M422DRAFT_257274 [Sphaerobolus stellatus SS14]|uniref:Uncharacterized protein n=1 Tax=Sphaerobolus stellatus (strain SS14) TaxID=990650 RepID=A0A0C9VPA8_SPHS4|nr:hypothetical protein M422DRAFT_257274 [Sphaerobolus stellatus SS14]